MKWEHKCSLTWMKMRQVHLTASDVKRLLPVTSTGRKRTIDETDYMKVYASKLKVLTEEDCMSYGAAARGHILESYAIDTLNDVLNKHNKKEMYWWDDELLIRNPQVKWGLAFSPDALSILPYDYYDFGEKPIAMAEVKCYNEEKHIITAYTEKNKLEERWQIATAMAVLDSIEEAYLVLFNPDMYRMRCAIREFDRNDLAEEIEIVNKIESDWLDFVNTYHIPPCLMTEPSKKIMKDIERCKSSILNPVV